MVIKILLFLYTTIIFLYDSLYCKILNETTYTDHSKFISKLDIRLSLVGQEFVMVYGDAFLIYMFENILQEINEFMRKNSGELIILLMKIDHYGDYLPSNSHYCEVLDIYIEEWKHKKLMLIKDWSLLEDYVGEHRGHVLLGHDDDNFSRCTTYLPCEVQNSWDTNLERKWQLIKDNYDKMLNPYYPYHSCYVNYLCSDNPVFFKNDTLTHYNNSDNFEKRLKATENINQLMANYFRNPIVTLVMIMTDFPTQELINNIINSNFY